MEEHTPTFASIGLPEQEVIIRMDVASGRAYISSSSATRSRRLTKLYGPPARVARNRDGHVLTAFWSIPLDLVGLRRPRKPGSGNPTGVARARAAARK